MVESIGEASMIRDLHLKKRKGRVTRWDTEARMIGKAPVLVNEPGTGAFYVHCFLCVLFFMTII